MKSCISPLAEMGKLAAGRNRNLNFLDEQRTKEMFWAVIKNSFEKKRIHPILAICIILAMLSCFFVALEV